MPIPLRLSGLAAARPTAPAAAGARFFATDSLAVTFSTGSEWVASDIVELDQLVNTISGTLAARPTAGTCVGHLYIDESGLRYEAFPGGWATMAAPDGTPSFASLSGAVADNAALVAAFAAKEAAQTAASQAEAEAGAETAIRKFSPLRIAQAIAALGGASGTTVGEAFLNLTNPSAVTFPRINANNSVTALSAATFRSAIGADVVATARIRYVDTATGDNGTAQLGNPAKPWATAQAAFDSGIASSTGFTLQLGAGDYTIDEPDVGITSSYLKEILGAGSALTTLSVNNSPASGPTAGYTSTLTVDALSLSVYVNGGTGGEEVTGGTGGSLTMVCGSRATITAAYANGGGAAGATANGDGGSVVISGPARLVAVGASAGSGGSGGAHGTITLEGVDARSVGFTGGAETVILSRCSYPSGTTFTDKGGNAAW